MGYIVVLILVFLLSAFAPVGMRCIDIEGYVNANSQTATGLDKISIFSHWIVERICSLVSEFFCLDRKVYNNDK